MVALLVAAGADPARAAISFLPHERSAGCRTWTFEFGVARITSSDIHEYFMGDLGCDDGPAGGEVWQFTAVRHLGELEWRIGGSVFRPQLELPLTIEIVDERGRDPFPDCNASFTVRWIDFPWNERVATTFSMGLGLSYSSKIYLMDIQRHPGEDRSRLKFNWPIQLTLAAPRFPDHQLMLFIAHQSGGVIFDRGGVNSLGLGYRLGF